jgi:hypothetical protein
MWCVWMATAVAGTACVPKDATSPWCVRPLFLDGSVPREGMVEVLLEGERSGTWGGGAAWESLGSWPAAAWGENGVLEVPVPEGREVAALRWEVVHSTGGWGETHEVRRPLGGWGATCPLPTPLICRFRARRPGGGEPGSGWQIVPWVGEPSLSLAAGLGGEESAFLPCQPPTSPSVGEINGHPTVEVQTWVRPEEFPGFSRTWGIFSKDAAGNYLFRDTVTYSHGGERFPDSCEVFIG